MASNSKNFCVGTTAGAAALTKYELVKTWGAVVVSAAATDAIVGVVTDGCDASSPVNLCIQGETYARASAAIAAGALLQPAADGEVATHTGTNTVVGRALEAATAQGDFIRIFLFGNHAD